MDSCGVCGGIENAEGTGKFDYNERREGAVATDTHRSSGDKASSLGSTPLAAMAGVKELHLSVTQFPCGDMERFPSWGHWEGFSASRGNGRESIHSYSTQGHV